MYVAKGRGWIPAGWGGPCLHMRTASTKFYLSVFDSFFIIIVNQNYLMLMKHESTMCYSESWSVVNYGVFNNPGRFWACVPIFGMKSTSLRGKTPKTENPRCFGEKMKFCSTKNLHPLRASEDLSVASNQAKQTPQQVHSLIPTLIPTLIASRVLSIWLGIAPRVP
jgi:hypothetical protein